MTGKRLKEKTPHFFAKCIVVFCVIFGAVCSCCSLLILYKTGSDPSSLLAVILGFFGGELLLLCLKTVLKKEGKNDGLESSDSEGG